MATHRLVLTTATMTEIFAAVGLRNRTSKHGTIIASVIRTADTPDIVTPCVLTWTSFKSDILEVLNWLGLPVYPGRRACANLGARAFRRAELKSSASPLRRVEAQSSPPNQSCGMLAPCPVAQPCLLQRTKAIWRIC